jgi:hypothetical protein
MYDEEELTSGVPRMYRWSREGPELLLEIVGGGPATLHMKKVEQVLEPSRLKKLISEAAAMDRRLWNHIIKTGSADPSFLVQEGGETLTCHVISIAITRDASKPSEKRFIEFRPSPPDPSKLGEAFDPEERGSGLLSILHPEYIRDLNWEASGEAVKGTFNFEPTNGAYHGTAGFVAQYAEADNPSSLYVSAFILEPQGINRSQNLSTNSAEEPKLLGLMARRLNLRASTSSLGIPFPAKFPKYLK